MEIKQPVPHDFIFWLGQFGTYMKAEHDVDLAQEFLSDPDAAKESAQFFMDCYRRGLEPKELADLLIEKTQERKNE